MKPMATEFSSLQSDQKHLKALGPGPTAVCHRKGRSCDESEEREVKENNVFGTSDSPLNLHATMTKLCMSLCLLSALSVVVMMLQRERGHVGQDLTFTCSKWYNGMDTKSHVKYLCRSPCKDEDVIVKAEPGETKRKDRISITNTGQSLSVTFTDLEMKDAKTYMCGLEKYLKDPLIKVELEVIDAVTPTPKTTPKSTTVGSMTSVSGSIKTLSDSDNMTHTFTPRTNSSVPTPTASGARGGGGRGGAGISPFLIVGLIVMVATLMVLVTLMKYLKRKPHMDSPGEEAGQDPEFVEIREEERRAESPSSIVQANVLYSTISLPQETEGSSQIYSNVQTVPPRVTESNNIYSAVMLPRGQLEPSDPNHDELLYSLAQLP
ncbi:uncharacterized protein LOC143013582 isoform X2 [Genypterus blacodes]|uniref:uncharacterized protein LOC143013582 isoform X2 n=1 Tax=Genypterus blacodes TaxID=154954 RepID=UPI003F76E71F